MRMIFIILLLFSTTLLAQEGWDSWKPYSSESYYEGKKDLKIETATKEYSIFQPKFYVSKMQNRFLSVDRFAEKYPSMSPYSYVLNNPLRFTDMTGDTVDVDPNLLKPIIYSEGDNKGKVKNIEDMTPEEQQRYYFQQWWSVNGNEVIKLFDVGGIYETTNINFKLGFQPIGFLEKLFTLPALNNTYYGRTAWGSHGMDEVDLYKGNNEILPSFGIDKLTINIYYSPDRARSVTAPHEWKHVSIIFDKIKNNETVPTGIEQHRLIDYGIVPIIK